MQESDSDTESDEEFEERIYFSLESGDAVLVKSLLDQGYNPNYKFKGRYYYHYICCW